MYFTYIHVHTNIHTILLQVAAYDFILPVLVNGHDPLPPPPSHWPPSHTSPQVALGHDCKL